MILTIQIPFFSDLTIVNLLVHFHQIEWKILI